MTEGRLRSLLEIDLYRFVNEYERKGLVGVLLKILSMMDERNFFFLLLYFWDFLSWGTKYKILEFRF